MAKLRVGDGLDAGTTTGPLISAAAIERVAAQVADATAKGAKVSSGAGCE